MPSFHTFQSIIISRVISSGEIDNEESGDNEGLEETKSKDSDEKESDQDLTLYQVADICRPFIYESLLNRDDILILSDFIKHIGLSEDMFRVDEFWDCWNSQDKLMLVNVIKENINYRGDISLIYLRKILRQIQTIN